MKDLRLVDIGSEVYIGGDIEATVISIHLQEGGRIAYEVVWWDGRSRNVKFVEAGELTYKDQESTKHIILTVEEDE